MPSAIAVTAALVDSSTMARASVLVSFVSVVVASVVVVVVASLSIVIEGVLVGGEVRSNKEWHGEISIHSYAICT